MDGDGDFGTCLGGHIGEGTSVGCEVVGRESDAVGQTCSAQTFEHEDAFGVAHGEGTRVVGIEACYLLVGEVDGLCWYFFGVQHLAELE